MQVQQKKKKRNIITERKKILNANRLQYFMIVNLKIQNQTDNFFVIYKLKFTQKEQELWVRKVINKPLLYKDRQTKRQLEVQMILSLNETEYSSNYPDSWAFS